MSSNFFRVDDLSAGFLTEYTVVIFEDPNDLNSYLFEWDFFSLKEALAAIKDELEAGEFSKEQIRLFKHTHEEVSF